MVSSPSLGIAAPFYDFFNPFPLSRSFTGLVLPRFSIANTAEHARAGFGVL